MERPLHSLVSLEKAKQPSFGICSIRSIWLQVPSFPVLAPACTAVMFGLLLSTLSRLTHILYAVLDGSNFRGTRGKQNTPEGGEGGPIFPRPSRSFDFPRLDRRVLGRRSRGANGAPRRPCRASGEDLRRKRGYALPDEICVGCIRKTGCERVKLVDPATSAPAESPKPRERHAPERYEHAFPAEIRDQRESNHEAARRSSRQHR